MIKTTNPEWGFFGTTQRNYNFSDEATERLFDVTAQMLSKQLKLSAPQIVSFLDSRYGRHFSDELSFHGAKDGMAEKDFVGVVRKYLKKLNNCEINNWVITECHNQGVFK